MEVGHVNKISCQKEITGTSTEDQIREGFSLNT